MLFTLLFSYKISDISGLCDTILARKNCWSTMTTMPPKEEKVDHAYYEELLIQLKEALSAKKAADKALSSVEDQIDKFEGVASFSLNKF